MTVKIMATSLLILFIFTTGFSQEKFNAEKYIDAIFEEYPSIACDLIKNKAIKQSFLGTKKIQRTKFFYRFSRELLTVKGKDLYFNGKPVVYLPPKEMKIKDFYKKNNPDARMMYRWKFDVPVDGNYLVVQPSFRNAQGFINKKPLVNIGYGILSQQFSGKKRLSLKAGTNIVELIKLPRKNIQLSILSEKVFNSIKQETLQHLKSTDEKDINWISTYLLPQLSRKEHGSGALISSILNTDAYVAYTKKYPKKSIERQKDLTIKTHISYEAYLISKQFFEKHPDLFIASIMQNNKTFMEWKVTYANTFLKEAICANNSKLVFTVLEKLIAYQKSKLSDDKHVAYSIGLYKSVLRPFSHFGQAKGQALAYRKMALIIKAAKKRGIKVKEISAVPDLRASNLVISESTEESQALNTQRLILDYKDEEAILKKCYHQLLSLKHSLIKSGDQFNSTRHIFVDAALRNKAFLKDFKKYSLAKLRDKIKRHISKKEITELENILAQFSMILKFPEIHRVLGELNFAKGSYEKAYFHLAWAAKINPELQPSVLSKLYILEDYCDLLPQNKTPLNQKQKNTVKFKGHQTTLLALKEKLKNNKIFKANAPGQLIKRIPLPNDHSQYWNHPVKLTHQGVVPTFTATKLFIATSNSILVFRLKDGKPLWENIGKNEYYRSIEPGPHQKRFVLEHSGTNIYQFGSLNFSGRKTIKSFKLNGELNWDLITFKGALQREPLSTPIANGGSLSFLSYDSKQTIPSIAFNFIDPANGKMQASIPIGVIPGRFGGKKTWNTYRHDQHFLKEDQFIYGYTGTGMLFKADTIAKQLLWGQSYIKAKAPHYFQKQFHQLFGYAPSGFIKTFDEVLVSYMPDIQTLTGTNKHTGQVIWRTGHMHPMLFHGRETKRFLYFTEHTTNQMPQLIKVDAKTGKTLWRKSTNGLIPQGEGDITETHIIIPCLKSLVFFDKKDGHLIKTIKLNLQPLKIVYGHNHWVLFTKKDAFLLNNSGEMIAAQLTRSPFKQTGFIKPEAKDIPLPYDSLTLEKSLYLPEGAYSNAGTDASIIATALPLHHILKRGQHITLFREGFEQKSTGTYIQPAILWYSQLPYHCLLKDKIIISEPGELRAEDLFTRKTLWSYKYQTELPMTWSRSPRKKNLLVVMNDFFIVFQTPSGTLRVLDAKTRKHLYDMRKGNAHAMVIIKSSLIVNNGNYMQACDLNKNGKFLWKKQDQHGFNIGKKKGLFLSVSRVIGTDYADPITGKKVYRFRPRRGYLDGQNTRILGEKYSINYNFLFDTKTGKEVTKYKEARAVRNGGYLCFFKKGGRSGHYLEGDKVYTFQSRGRFDSRNSQLASIKKGNKLLVYSIYSIETYELQKDKVVLIDYISTVAAHYGGRDNTSLHALDNSIMTIRGGTMSFLRQFDPYNHFNKIKSFRVKNNSKSSYPYSEVYPEIEVKDSQWISNNGAKPSRKIYYQAFANNKKAFLHFRISPQVSNEEKTLLRISANEQGMPVVFHWDPDLWEHCTTSFHVKDSVKSWKETDQDGYIHLYITIPLGSFVRRFRYTLPDFGIEFRQFKNEIETGLYRIGGAFYYASRSYRAGSMKIFGWDNYVNDEAQTLHNFKLRSNIYLSGNGFFPQGLELEKWIIDSRRFHSPEDNIKKIKELAKRNANAFCVVNILALLLKEELHIFKTKHPQILEIDPKFYETITANIKKVEAYAKSIGIKDEWIKFSLTFHTIEIFPSKEVLNFSRHHYHKAVFGHYISGHRRQIIKTYYENTDDPAIHDINKPHLKYFFTALLTGYPHEKSASRIGLTGVQITNTCLGKLIRFEPGVKKELWNRDFSKQDPAVLIKGKKPLASISRDYFFNLKTYKCFSIKGKRPVTDIGFNTAPISIPSVKKDIGLKYENIITSLKNLPSDSQLGTAMMTTITAQNKNMKLEDFLTLSVNWLSRINQNEKAFFKAIKYIHHKFRNTKGTNIYTYKSLFKSAKIPSTIQRIFLLDYYFKLNKHSQYSFLGPIKEELKSEPFENTDLSIKYSNGKKDYQFGKFSNGKNANFYIALKLETKKRKKVYLYYRNPERSSGAIISAWLNKRQAIESTSFNQNRHQMIFKRLSLKKGSNLLIIKLEDIQELRNGRMTIGDKNGFPLKGVTIKPAH